MALEWKKLAFVEDVISDTAYSTSWDGVTDVAPSKNAVYDKLQLMSALFPAALGAANLKQFMNAAGTAPEWASSFKSGSFTRVCNAVNANISYTGVGFKPSAIIVIGATTSTSYCSIGFAAGASAGAMFMYNNTGQWSMTGNVILIHSGADAETGALASFDSDGFTISWAMAVSGCATTVTFYYLALR